MGKNSKRGEAAFFVIAGKINQLKIMAIQQVLTI